MLLDHNAANSRRQPFSSSLRQHIGSRSDFAVGLLARGFFFGWLVVLHGNAVSMSRARLSV